MASRESGCDSCGDEKAESTTSLLSGDDLTQLIKTATMDVALQNGVESVTATVAIRPFLVLLEWHPCRQSGYFARRQACIQSTQRVHIYNH